MKLGSSARLRDTDTAHTRRSSDTPTLKQDWYSLSLLSLSSHWDFVKLPSSSWQLLSDWRQYTAKHVGVPLQACMQVWS